MPNFQEKPATGVRYTMSSEAKIEKIECGRLIHHRHCLGESNYHLQFTPAFRRKVFLESEVRNMCRKLFYEKAKELSVALLAVEFGPDHCHLFVGNCRNYSVPDLTMYFKGYSSRFLRKDLNHVILQYIWGERFWSAGYFYESVGRVTSKKIKFYIERQQGKHWINLDHKNVAGFTPLQNTKLTDFL